MSGPLGDMGSLLKQAQQMQRELDKVREELASRQIEGTAGGRAVVVTLTGSREVVSVEISEELAKDGQRDTIQEMVLVALRDALGQVESISSEEMGKVTGGLNLPGLM
ncbi:MAG: YbaB/EbfC family nucleoid-associated protein [Planctomycetota bacterium]|nr:YbaB/EbfC family nucleoid-associated protein [Planctomycetota bacterium]